MVSGQIDAGFNMAAYVQDGSVTFAVFHKTGTMYYSEQDLDKVVEHLKVYANKEKQGD